MGIVAALLGVIVIVSIGALVMFGPWAKDTLNYLRPEQSNSELENGGDSIDPSETNTSENKFADLDGIPLQKKASNCKT